MSQKTVMGVFDERASAKQAVEALFDQGFSHREVSLLSPGDEEGLAAYQEPEEHHDGGTGAATGGALGGLAGLLIGIGLLTVPGVGPIVVAGPIASTLVGAITGAVVGSFMGILMDFGVPEDDAHLYAEAVRRGASIVAVTAPPERVESVTDTLASFGPADLKERAEQWKAEGWSRFDETAEPLPREVLATRPPIAVNNPTL